MSTCSSSSSDRHSDPTPLDLDELEASVLVNADEEYTVLGFIEKTRDGCVLCARDQDGEEVAIKVIQKSRAYARKHGRESILVEQRIMREVTELGNPFLAQLLASWDDEENVYLVMRLCYTTLYDTMCFRKLRGVELELYAAELIMALCTLHEAGIMHRDIKAENILIAPSGHAVLADFGLAFARPSDDIHCKHPSNIVNLEAADPEPDWIVQSGTVVGSLGYMAPEVITLIESTTYSMEADVWALGMTLLELALGLERPFYFAQRRDEVSRLMMTYDPPLDLLPRSKFRDLLSKMLIRSPFRRWTTQQLKGHILFKGLNWELLKRGTYRPVVCPGFPQVSLEDAQAHFRRPGHSHGLEYFEAQMLLDEEEDVFNYRCPDELRALQDSVHNVPDDTSSSGDDTLAEEREARGDEGEHYAGSRSQNDRPVDKEGREVDEKEHTTVPPAVVVVNAKGEQRNVPAAAA